MARLPLWSGLNPEQRVNSQKSKLILSLNRGVAIRGRGEISTSNLATWTGNGIIPCHFWSCHKSQILLSSDSDSILLPPALPTSFPRACAKFMSDLSLSLFSLSLDPSFEFKQPFWSHFAFDVPATTHNFRWRHFEKERSSEGRERGGERGRGRFL